MGPKRYYYCSKCRNYSTGRAKCGHEREYLFSNKQKVKLSKFLSYILRHDPKSLGIDLDVEGFSQTPLDEMVDLIKKTGKFDWLNRRKLDALMFLTKSHKIRFEVRDNRIRAKYGHSMKEVSIKPTNGEIPDSLYHGTNVKSYKLIRLEGIKPMGRNQVHLTTSISDAKVVATRHGGEKVILEIDAKKARIHGVGISQASPTIFVADFIPNRFVKRIL